MIKNTSNRNKSCTCSGSCDCQSAACESNGHGYTRPNFFAGQLLTDEDLRPSLSYVVEKNRLHNRHFFGEGVVCGLEVQHHPCPDDQNKVIVGPGHALDCCGNDIVVPCEVELDILKMVHELRTRMRGDYDCGDPCDKKGILVQPDPFKPGVQVIPTLKYCLFLRYREHKSDMVLPYQVDDECSATCKASRIRESFSFELRCPEEPEEPADMQKQLQEYKKAIPEYRKHQSDTLHSIRTLETAEQVLTQYSEIIQNRDLNSLIEQLQQQSKAVNEAVSKIPESVEGAPPSVSVAVQRDAAFAAHEYLTLAYRCFFAPAGSELGDPVKSHVESVQAIQQILAAKLPRLKNVEKSGGRLIAIESSIIDELMARNNELLTVLQKGESGDTFDGKARIVGELVVEKIVTDAVKQIDLVNDRMRANATTAQVVVGPELREVMDSVKLRRFIPVVPQQLKRAEKLRLVIAEAQKVSRVVAEISQRGLCQVILPPCPPCDDPAVLLACVTVRECKVIDICNLDRKLIITGPSLRYWLSDFKTIMRPIHDACCPPPEAIQVASTKKAEKHNDQIKVWKEKAFELRRLQSEISHALAWYQLRTADDEQRGFEVDQSLRFAAISPPPPQLFDLITGDAEGYEGLGQQSLNIALSSLAGRPPADVRDFTENWKSPAEIERKARVALEQLAQRLEPRVKSASAGIEDALKKARAAEELAIGFRVQLEQEARDRENADALEKQTREKALADELVARNNAITAAVDENNDPVKSIKSAIAANASAIKEEVNTDRDKAIRTALDDALKQKVNVATHNKLRTRFEKHEEHPPGAENGG